LTRRPSPLNNNSVILPKIKEDVIKGEIARLLVVGFIKEVYHPNWLANPILVPKKNRDWRVCFDYTDLNKACKKDPFVLHQIYQVMDSKTGCNLLSFLDCYLGYHQIPLKEEDQIKTSFMTPFDAFCHTTMSFGLKSAGATYQRGIQWCLHTQLGCNAKAYVDDVVIKTREDEGLISDLADKFDNLRKFKMKLNHEKCIFCVFSSVKCRVIPRRGIFIS
jgi:hypothetical protein